ncbi:hypothetical protein AC068_14025 [Morganella morganii]|uniref:oligosaccharide flippase family protein n=1 Tax=Morganella morganii TaxID=582 RepID=UPI0006C5DF72|nr:oligosaccharide flippase family protein [Morganella morganii]EKW7746468.1 oligosaccharide flippase family protein [Morganella morganii]KOO18071.1 hypothetical protein AC068_14025 [Morganella morganii]HCR3200818.1 oligosaccharide flippase family protein [Morganella morganii]
MIEKLTKYKKQLSNFFYLSCLQFVNMILPLIILPFLLHKLGLENYGKVVFSLAIASYFTILINFGFNVAITREISIHRERKERLSIIVSNTLFIKLTLFILSFSSVFIVNQVILKNNDIIYYYALLISFGEMLFPLWFFQGMEKMKYITYINVTIKIAFTIALLFFIENKEDYIYVPMLQGISGIIGGVIALIFVFQHIGIRVTVPSVRYILVLIKKGYVFLLADIAAVIKDKTNIIVIGQFIGMVPLAYYDIAEKIVWAFRSLFVNITNAFFPFFAKNKPADDVKLIIKITFILSIICYLILTIFSGKIILLLSSETLLPAQYLLYIMGTYIIFATLSSNIGQSILIVNSLYKEFLQNLFLSTLFYLVFLGLLIIINADLYMLSILYISSIIFELVHRIYICKKKNLISWII